MPEDFVLGSDEAGYGAYAGPLTVAAVLVPRGWVPTVRIGDSKQLTEKARETSLKGLLADKNVVHAVVSVSPERIDEMGVYKALIWAHTEAHRQVFLAAGEPKSVERIVDGTIPVPLATSLPKADTKIPACSAASIIAKTTRDHEMIEMSKVYPGYGFQNHKGYGGGDDHEHTIALVKLGVCPIHRKSYAPIARLLQDAVTVANPVDEWEQE